MSKVAVIGAGAWGKNIVKTLSELDALGCVAESSQQLRDSLAKQYPKVPFYSEYEAALSVPHISAVAIATPVPTHHRIAKDCLLAGKDVFVEKPITLTVSEAEDLVSLAEKRDRILMVGHLLVYKPAIEFIWDYLASGKLGRVFTFHQERAKLGKARAVENALWSLGVHDVAALLYLANEIPTQVSFIGHQGLQNGVEDDTFLHMTFADGRQAHLHNSWLWPEDRRGLTIVGTEGMLVYEEREECVTLIRKSIDAALANVDHGSEVLFRASKDFQPLRVELGHFLDCVHTRKTPRTCGRNGLEVVRVLERAAA